MSSNTVDNEGNTTCDGRFSGQCINSMEAAIKHLKMSHAKHLKNVGIFKKEKCLDRGVTIGGKHMDEYMPQFINFFKENLL